MSNILNKEQSNRIRDIRAQIMKLGLDDWMCEGADDNAIILFNNKEDKSICVDYISGKVLYAHTYNHNDDLGSFELTPELRQLVRLESEIARICYC